MSRACWISALSLTVLFAGSAQSLQAREAYSLPVSYSSQPDHATRSGPSGQPSRNDQAQPEEQSPQEAEARVLDYIQQNLHSGQPLIVSRLYAHFTEPAERQALGKLYNAFFRIPLFVAQYQQKFGKPPALDVISQQFDLHTPQAASVLLSVMESDPRVPRFITRDPRTHEITHVDVEMIKDSPRFGQELAHQISGWQGRAAPAFHLERIGGGAVDSAQLRGKPYLLYVWFTGCPPCMKETPFLVSLMTKFLGSGFTVIGANADNLLKLGYSDSVRQQYARHMGINFPMVAWTTESNQAYGNVAIFPTLFLVGRDGVIKAHWVGFTPSAELQSAVSRAIKPSKAPAAQY